MDFKDWKPIYNQILKDFEYQKKEDINAAKLISEMRRSDKINISERIKGKVVEVLGPHANGNTRETFLVAGAALSNHKDYSEKPSFLVTDLDGDTELQLRYNLDGVITLIHAHGDNIDLIKKWAKRFSGPVISTCQCRPPKGVYNFGGFTDGDRCVFLADHFNAKKIILTGWNFDEPALKEGDTDFDRKMKKKKLKWAKRLIKMVKTPVEFRE